MEGRGQHQAAQGSSPGPPDTRKQAQCRLQRVWGHFSGVTGCGERMWPGTVWGERGAGASRRCPRRALGPMNSAWAKGRGRRAALWRAAAFVRVSSDCGRQSCRLNIALRRTAAATGSNGCCHYTSYSRARRRHFLAPAVLLGREPSPTPPRVGFSGVPQHAARAGERPPRQTDSCCNYPTS